MVRHLVTRAAGALPFVVLLLGACSRNEEARRDAGSAPATSAVGGAAPGAAGRDAATLARADAGRITGDSAAPLWLVVVSDFQCPYCKTWEDETAPTIVRDYVRSGRVRMAFVNLPLSIHPNAGPAAESAMCAAAQDKFWPVHDAIFATQPAWAGAASAVTTFDSLAVGAGVEPVAYRACVASGATRPLVQADAQRAAAAGVRSTPTFMITSRARPGAPPATIQGAAPVANFRAVLDSMLRDAGAPAAGAAR